MERRRILVAGQVQGVFFRASTAEVAREAGCTGWVGNRRDGRVEAEVQGPRAAVERVIEHCRVGPPAAEVSDVAVEERPIEQGERGFSTR